MRRRAPVALTWEAKPLDTPRTVFTRKSRNVKLGPIPATYTEKRTCPDACPLKGAGCYASAGGRTRLAWALAENKPVDSWHTMLANVRALPPGQLWRHNVAGDLPGTGDAIDTAALAELTAANTGRRGFTYTHKPMTPENAAAVRAANDAGFVVNLSANNLAHADDLIATGAGPVVSLVPADYPATGGRTPAGRPVVVCPEMTGTRPNCASCGACAIATRKPVIGFRVHGGQQAAAAAVAAGGADPPSTELELERKAV